MYQQVLTTFSSQPIQPKERDSQVEILALEVAAQARLHRFAEADQTLRQATQACQTASETPACGDVPLAAGVLAVQRGQNLPAKQSFERALSFARAGGERLLEATALLNLGLTSLREQHFDEAIDWTDAAYRASMNLGADDLAQTAVGNLGWAYYNLGDADKSLRFSLEARERAIRAGDVIDELSWLTNAGYVYAQEGDLARARESYLSAYDLAASISGREDIYNALRALALVSIDSGDLNAANKYSDEAIAMARADKNREDELYPLLVKGLVASAAHDLEEGERMFREVEGDPKATASLKWRAEHALAHLYQDEKRPDQAGREFQTALATFEAARSSLRRNDSRLPFSNNASRIYDDYIHFLVAQGKTNDALRWADYSRGRTLAEGLGLLPQAASTEPPQLNAQDIARRAGATVLFYWMGEQSSYLWAITANKTAWFPLPAAAEIEAAAERYHKALQGPQDVFGSANEDGSLLYRTLIAPARELLPKDAKVIIIPDGKLNNLNFETLLVDDPALHYWIEDATVVTASSLRLLAAPHAGSESRHAAKENRDRRLLLLGNAVSASPEYPELPNASVEMTSVEKHFPSAQQRVFQRDQATPGAYLASSPEKFFYIHFVAHGMASRLSPLDSAIILSKSGADNESFKLYARDIIQHPVSAELVTISACYGAGTRAYAGEGLVGLSWAFLRAGARNVIAALWDASDVSSAQLMDKFYDELNRGRSSDAALRAAKLSLLHSGSAFRKPLYWAPFQLYAGSGS